jgi:small multidrug resistance family-3 protein
MTLVTWFTFLAAAILEVCGDAVIRRGLLGKSPGFILIGGLILTAYGLLVNTVKWDFSKLLGVYVAAFAVVSLVAGHVIFKEQIPLSSWLGLLLIVTGGLIIQYGS